MQFEEEKIRKVTKYLNNSIQIDGIRCSKTSLVSAEIEWLLFQWNLKFFGFCVSIHIIFFSMFNDEF